MTTSPPPKSNNLDSQITSIGHDLARLDPGPLADLRRLDFDSPTLFAPIFWRLASRHELPQSKEREWASIIQMMAILTDKGSPEDRPSPHRPRNAQSNWRGLGHALCDGGDEVGWGTGQPEPRPVFSEQRFARLLAAKDKSRAELLLRAIRMLAAKKPADAQICCTDFARLLLSPENPKPARQLASDYYKRLDGKRKRDDDDNSSNEGDL